ncbi:MAG: maleylpyruvate isomerase family mycothiol-dependent enzyme [Acidimicrobiales bacterium]
MAKVDIWPTVAAERRALAADLSQLGDERWETRSLCEAWTVRDTLAHMTATAKITPASFFPKLAGSGFSFLRLQAKDIAAERGASPADTLRGFEEIVDSKKRPPGPPLTMMGETLLHAEDIRRPLGISHAYPADWLAQVADFYKGSNLILGTKRRIAGLSLRATDAAWSHGTGPEVSGPLLALLLVMTGRKAALSELQGPGVEVLRGR